MYYKFHKISLNRGGSYIDSPKWLNSKKATINPRNKKYDKYFQCAITTALNHQYIKKDSQRISKVMPFRKNQVILLMITDGKKWHYLSVKELSAFLRGITSKHDRDFYCLNYSYSFRKEDALEKHENICKDHDFCFVKMPDKDNHIY